MEQPPVQCPCLRDGDKGAVLQRDRQTYGIAPHLPCGLCTPDILRKLADVAEKYGAQLKVTSAERIALLGIKPEDVDAVWAELGMKPGHIMGLVVRSVKACPGTAFCKLGKQDSIAVGRILDEKYNGMPLPGKMKMGVSGCTNQCAETNFKDIALVGKPRGWMLMAGGCGGGMRPRIANILADGLTTEQALAAVDKLVQFFKANAKKHERMGRMMDRMGVAAVQAAIGLPRANETKIGAALRPSA